MMLLKIIILLGVVVCSAAALKNVIVSGAAGRTGSLVFSKLLSSDKWNPIAVVRTEKSRKKLISKTKCSDANVICSDILDEEKLLASFNSVDAEKLILCTSAVPKIKKRSIVKIILYKLIRKEGGRPDFRFIQNGDPYHVDFIGATNQFKAAKATGTIDQVVVVGSMGGTP